MHLRVGPLAEADEGEVEGPDTQRPQGRDEDVQAEVERARVSPEQQRPHALLHDRRACRCQRGALDVPQRVDAAVQLRFDNPAREAGAVCHTAQARQLLEAGRLLGQQVRLRDAAYAKP